jgi:hypothetical protein
VPRKAKDLTKRLELQALAHSLEMLFRSKSLHPDEAIADAVGVSRDLVREGRFFYRLGRGCEAGLSGTSYDLQAVIARLREIAWIRPATEMAGASLWPFLRGELTPNVSVCRLVEHHIARVKFTRVGMGEHLWRHLVAAHARKPIVGLVFPVPAVANAREREVTAFMESTVAVTDKLTIVGLLFVEAFLAGNLQKAARLVTVIRHFTSSRPFEDAFGPVAPVVREEFRERLFRGRLLSSYGQRWTAGDGYESFHHFLLPSDAAESFLANVVDAMIAGAQQESAPSRSP